VKIDRQAAGRYGLSVEEVANTVAAALGGREAGLLFEGDRRFAVVVRLPDAQRDDLETLARSRSCCRRGAGRALDPAARGGAVQLHAGLNQISRENGKRMVVVQVNVRGRDLGGFVRKRRRRSASSICPPACIPIGAARLKACNRRGCAC
jgi:cobalt-zinc-cadmium resistance protein CzcA